jgi:hypothetical protein
MKKEMAGSNRPDREQLKGYLAEIDVAQSEIDSLRDDYVESCRPHREQIKAIKEVAKDAGVNMEAFNVLLGEHNAERRHKQRVAKLDLMDRADYEEMAQALGDFGSTPLGTVTLERAKAQEASLDSLT